MNFRNPTAIKENLNFIMLRRLFGYPFRLDLFCISVAMSLVLARTCARLVTGSEWRQSTIMYVIPFSVLLEI